MALYLLSYDIPVKDTEDVYAYLETFLKNQRAMRILKSAWLVPWGNESNAEALVEAASQHVDKESRIIACELFKEKHTRSWVNLKESDSDVRDLLGGQVRV
jgi:hypothetical protein